MMRSLAIIMLAGICLNAQAGSIPNLGCEVPPCNNQDISIRVAMMRPAYVRSSANTYENVATGLGKFTGWQSNHLGSPIEPPLYCNWQSNMIIEMAMWQAPPPWINATNCIPELASYSAALVTRYKGLIAVIEPFNEGYSGYPCKEFPWVTNDVQYAAFFTELTHQVRLAVKAVDPTVEIWGPTFSNPFSQLNFTLIAAGYARYIDAWDFHDYSYLHGAPPASPTLAQNLVALRVALGWKIPFVITEGYVPDTEHDITGMVQDYRNAGCSVFCFTSLWGVYSGIVQTNPFNDAQAMACWSDPVTMKLKLKLFLNALK